MEKYQKGFFKTIGVKNCEILDQSITKSIKKDLNWEIDNCNNIDLRSDIKKCFICKKGHVVSNSGEKCVQLKDPKTKQILEGCRKFFEGDYITQKCEECLPGYEQFDQINNSECKKMGDSKSLKLQKRSKQCIMQFPLNTERQDKKCGKLKDDISVYCGDKNYKFCDISDNTCKKNIIDTGSIWDSDKIPEDCQQKSNDLDFKEKEHELKT